MYAPPRILRGEQQMKTGVESSRSGWAASGPVGGRLRLQQTCRHRTMGPHPSATMWCHAELPACRGRGRAEGHIQSWHSDLSVSCCLLAANCGSRHQSCARGRRPPAAAHKAGPPTVPPVEAATWQGPKKHIAPCHSEVPMHMRYRGRSVPELHTLRFWITAAAERTAHCLQMVGATASCRCYTRPCRRWGPDARMVG